MIEIAPADLAFETYRAFNNDWALLTAGTPDNYNTMTIGWGMFGCIWAKPAVTVYVRQSRFTKQFMDEYPTFSVTFFSKEHKKELSYLGTASGRDGDKIAQTSLTPLFIENTPCFEETTMTLICEKKSVSDIALDEILSDDVLNRFYSEKNEGDFHSAYIGFVSHAYKNI